MQHAADDVQKQLLRTSRVTTDSGLGRPELARTPLYDPESASRTTTFCSTPATVPWVEATATSFRRDARDRGQGVNGLPHVRRAWSPWRRDAEQNRNGEALSPAGGYARDRQPKPPPAITVMAWPTGKLKAVASAACGVRKLVRRQPASNLHPGVHRGQQSQRRAVMARWCAGGPQRRQEADDGRGTCGTVGAAA
jgi:hypothetical protein